MKSSNICVMVLSATLAIGGMQACRSGEVPMTESTAGFHPLKHSHAKSKDEGKDGQNKSDSAPLFPKATRKDPDTHASEKMQDKLKQLTALDKDKKYDEEIALSGQILADASANAYDRAYADQAIAYAHIANGAYDQAIPYLQMALQENALPNDMHYQLMLPLAQLQVSQQKQQDGVATLDRLVAETGEDKPEYEALRGNALYQIKRYPEAIAAINKAVAGSTQPDDNWLKILMASYYDSNQYAEAATVAEKLLAKNPNDKDLILNLSSIYVQANQNDKAAALLDDARKRGLLTDASDYRQLYALYGNIKGREKDSIAVINDGLQKGILKPDAEVYSTLGQDYYFSGQTEPAIEAYKKADAASSDGEAALTLAKIYKIDGRLPEARAAAETALKKGVKQPGEARTILGEGKPSTSGKPRKK